MSDIRKYSESRLENLFRESQRESVFKVLDELKERIGIKMIARYARASQSEAYTWFGDGRELPNLLQFLALSAGLAEDGIYLPIAIQLPVGAHIEKESDRSTTINRSLEDEQVEGMDALSDAGRAYRGKNPATVRDRAAKLREVADRMDLEAAELEAHLTRTEA